MTIYDYLKLDHDFVSQLFKLFQNSELTVRRKQIVDMISDELLVHAHSEQDTLYAALVDSEANVEIKHSKKEHKDIENQIKLIQEAKRFDSHWVKKVEKLKEMVDHHVKEEENKVFDKAEIILSKEDAYRLKEQMHYLKMNLMISKRKK